MPLERSINITISSKVLAATALGAGVLLGAGTAYLLTQIHEHSNLADLVSHLHTTIKEVKQDLANIENELSTLQGPAPLPEERAFKRRHRKAVSFSSTSSSFRTAEEPTYIVSNETFSDTASFRTAHTAYDTDYFSPDEDEEFFDVAPIDDESELYGCDLKSFDGSRRISDDVSDLSNLIRAVDNLIDRSPDDQIEAYNLLMDKGHKYENNTEILWRKAKAARNFAVIEGNKGNMERKKELFNEGYEYATSALQINDCSGEVHKWFAILSGSRGEFISTKERILSGQEFKKHIDIALELSPNDSTLHHLLGRYCFELSLLSWLERKVAATLFGEVPNSSFEEALEHFIAAEEMKPEGWKDNRFFIGKCYLKMNFISKAETWLRKAMEIPTVTASDEAINQEIDELAIQYSLQL